MPLPDPLRSELQSVPDLHHSRSLPAGVSKPADVELSYGEFEFDTDDRVGKGGNAVVYRATVPSQGLTVALKRPFPNRTVETETITRILGEAERWQQVVDHPYIADILDWGYGSRPWIAIEYLDGGPLTEHTDQFTVLQRLWTAYALADAVVYAHKSGVAHHDLNPQNILLRSTPAEMFDIPKIVDWGLSRELIQHTGSISQATPEYAAPEQFDAYLPETPVGVHTDVYQLGVVCYELLTGTHPNHLQGDLRPPSELTPGLPAAVDSVILQTLVDEKADRTEHPLYVRDGLERVIGQIVQQDNPNEGSTETSSESGLIVANDASSDGNTTVANESNSEGDIMIADNYAPERETTVASEGSLRGDFAKEVPPESGITVIGCGGAGTNTITRMAKEGVEKVKLVAADTDAQHLADKVQAHSKIQLGHELTGGRSTGSVPELGGEATRESIDEIRASLSGSDVVFVTVGLGGGTGTTAAPIVAQIAQEMDALTVASAIIPFSSEGKQATADAGFECLRPVSDTVILVPNDRLLDCDSSMPLQEAFHFCDRPLIRLVETVTELATEHGSDTDDFEDVRRTLKRGDTAMVGLGESDDRPNAKESTLSALQSPFLDVALDEVDSVFVTFAVSPDTVSVDIDRGLAAVRRRTGSDTRAGWKVIVDDGLQSEVVTMVLVTGTDN